MTATAQDVLRVARAELGEHESPYGSNRQKYGEWYGMNGVAWCDIFQSWVAARANAADLIGKFAYTPSHAQWFRDHGRWGHAPAVGAIVFFEWPGMGRIAHVGIVEAVHSDGSVTTIEGNTDVQGGRTGGAVMRKTRRANIAGYGYPRYASPVKPPASHAFPLRHGEWYGTDDGTNASHSGARHGDVEQVKAIQRKAGVTPDGEYGPKTKRAVAAWQRAHKLTADGEVGPNTYKAMFG